MNSIRTKTTYLEMRSPPGSCPPAPEGVTIAWIERPSVEFYRFLYNSVGRDYYWIDRNRMPDEDLRQIIQDEHVEVYVLSIAGAPAGYAELDRRQPDEIELAYFGLFPEFVGKGLGKFFLGWAVARAWSYAPQRVWVHTCDLDHPAALPNYVKAGFVVYAEQVIEQVVVEPR
jgi:GNAT superfamily N-acetyltransferase